MNRARTILLLLMIVGSAFYCFELRSDVPRSIRGIGHLPEGRPPLWLAADEILGDGQIRWEALPSHTRSYLELALRSVEQARKLAKQPADGCLVELSPATGETGWAHTTTLDERVRRAKRALVGTVRDARAGFLRGNIGTLYEIETTLDTEPEGSVETALMFHPSARLTLDGATVCYGDTQRAERAFARGKEIAILIGEVERPVYDSIILPLRNEVVERTDDGSASVIDADRAERASFAEVRQRIADRARLQRGEKR